MIAESLVMPSHDLAVSEFLLGLTTSAMLDI
ncbi:hypothetical protein LINPERHAP1_LOCUS30001 [Linum perenne]